MTDAGDPQFRTGVPSDELLGAAPVAPPHAEDLPADEAPHTAAVDATPAVPDAVDDTFADEPVVPPVVAVVVTNEPGPWLEETLAALGAQDYPSLSVLVVDAGSATDPTPRIAAVLPHAYVRRLPGNVGFAAAANEVLQVVEGASHFLLCHDDVAPEPDAVRLLVEEAFRSNAGIVAPKLVDWDDPRRLLQVGRGADKSGAPDALVEPGELDQEQHDAVKDVFVAPGGCTLVRSDLFATLGGYDAAMTLFEEDLDLSWRAQVAGARVIVAPAARVRHVQALSSGRRGIGADPPPPTPRAQRDRHRPLHIRHRLRAVLTCYGRWHAVRVVPQVALLAVFEVLVGLVTGNRAAAGAIVGAWRWNLARRPELREARRRLAAIRSLPDGEVRRLQVRGSARARAVVRGQLIGTETHEGPAARWLAAPDELLSTTGRAVRRRVGLVTLLTLVLVVGSRQLITGGVPAVGRFAPIDGSPVDLLQSYLSGWRVTGLGGEVPAPPAFALLGIVGSVLFGSTGLLRTVLVLGALPLGVIGARRLARPLGARAAVAAPIVYLLLPLPYASIAGGRLGGLVAYALAPWLLAGLAAATGVEPFGSRRAVDDGASSRRGRARIAALGMATAVGLALDPAVVAVPVVLVVGLLLASLVAGRDGAAARATATAGALVGVAVALLFPWTLDAVLPGSAVTSFLGVDRPPTSGISMLDAVRFHTGPYGGGVLGYTLPLAALLPLVVGQGWRLRWATRCWGIVLVAWLAAWGTARLGLPAPPAEVLLAGGGAALATAVALGVAAFELDLPAHRFGWRQTVSAAAGIAVALAALPLFAAAVGGRWAAPTTTFGEALAWMPEQRRDGDFRILWLGDPAVLPLGGWRLDEGVAYGLSRNGTPTVVDQWPSASPGAADVVADAVRIARRGETTSLGRLLGPAAVRYLVVPSTVAPGLGSHRASPAPPDLIAALATQVDLRRVDSDRGLVVYENVAYVPVRAAVDPATADALRDGGAGRDEAGAARRVTPVLPGGATAARGDVPAGPLFVAEAASPRWRLEVDGRPVPQERSRWAMRFDVPAAGDASLRYSTAPARWLALLLQAALWVGAATVVLRSARADRRRRAAGDGAQAAPPAPPGGHGVPGVAGPVPVGASR